MLNNTNITGEQKKSLSPKDVTKKKSSRIDRSNAKYSEEDFLKLPRKKQLQLAETYLLNMKSEDFDDGTFQFSRSHFASICERIGFKKGFIDANGSQEEKLYIDHRKRKETIIKKITLSKKTVEKIDKLLGDNLSKVEKSKIIDLLLEQIIDEKLALKEAGKFKVAYRPTDEERLI